MINFTYIYRIVIFIFLLLTFSGCFPEDEGKKHYQPSTVWARDDELIVGIHPYLNSEKTFLTYGPILRYLEHDLGKKLRLETSVNYQDYERKLYAGYFDISIPNPYQTLNALEKGYKVIAKVKPDQEFRGIIVARKDIHIRSVEQLRGQPISFPAPTALAATLMPKWFLFEHGLNVDMEANPRYVGSQYSSIINAYTKDTAAAATWPSPWKTWQLENPNKAKEMEVIWETPHLVNNGVVVKSDLDKKVAVKLAELLAKMDQTPQGQKLMAPTGFLGFEKADEKTYNPVKAFLLRYDREIGLPNE